MLMTADGPATMAFAVRAAGHAGEVRGTRAGICGLCGRWATTWWRRRCLTASWCSRGWWIRRREAGSSADQRHDESADARNRMERMSCWSINRGRAMAFQTDDPALAPIAAKVEAGERLSFDDGVALYRSGDILAVGWLANLVRERMHGDIAYFNVNRHINPTNVCVASCRLCAFGRKKGEAGTYTMALEEAWETAGTGLTRGGDRVSHRWRAASGSAVRVLHGPGARVEGALSEGAHQGVHDGGGRVSGEARQDDDRRDAGADEGGGRGFDARAAARRSLRTACGTSSATTRSMAASGWRRRGWRIRSGCGRMRRCCTGTWRTMRTAWTTC